MKKKEIREKARIYKVKGEKMRVRDNELLKLIYEEIIDDEKVTEFYLARKYNVTERTIRRYIKVLKDRGILTIEDSGIFKRWIIKKF